MNEVKNVNKVNAGNDAAGHSNLNCMLVNARSLTRSTIDNLLRP